LDNCEISLSLLVTKNLDEDRTCLSPNIFEEINIFLAFSGPRNFGEISSFTANISKFSDSENAPKNLENMCNYASIF